MVYGAAALQGAFGVMLPASSAALRTRLDLSDTIYGSLFLPFLLLALVTSLLAAPLLRRFSLRQLFLIPITGEIVALLLMALAGTAPPRAGLGLLFAAVALAGPCLGMLGISMNTAAIELLPERRDRALSALHGTLGTGAAIWPLLVGALASARAWGWAPLLLAGGFAVVASGMLGRPIRGLTERIEEDQGRAGLPRGLWPRTATAFVYGIGEATFTVWAVLFLFERRGLPMATATGALSAFWVAMTGGRFLAAWVVRWISARALSILLSLMMAVSFLLVARAESATGSLLAFGLAGLSCSALFPLLFALTSRVYPERTPQVSAVFSAAVLGGIAIGSFVIGPLRARLGLEAIYRASAVGPLLLVLAILATERGAAAGSLRGVVLQPVVWLFMPLSRFASRRRLTPPPAASVTRRQPNIKQ